MMGQSTTPVAGPAELPGRISSPEPHPFALQSLSEGQGRRPARVPLGQGQRGMFYVLRLA